MNKGILFLILLFIGLLLVSSIFWLYEAKYFVGNARALQSDFLPENSYLFVSPLRAAANNQEKIRVTVFVLNNQGLGVSARNVSLENQPNLRIEGVQAQTDSFGKAVFDISSNKPGEYFLGVQVDGRNLPQKVRLSFN